MKDLMRLRLRGDGPEAWKFRIEDVETGKALPVMEFTLDVRDHVLTLNCTLMVSEVDIDGVISIPDLVRQVTAESETVDEFAARTVAFALHSSWGRGS